MTPDTMYSKTYDRHAIRRENPDFVSLIKPYLRPDMRLLDLGSGTCRKTLCLSPLVADIDAIDRSPAMLREARRNIRRAGARNIRLFLGDNLNTPFPSRTYDVITTALSHFSAAEAHRLLKTSGLFFIETLDPEDKDAVKRAFGRDALGWRGYLTEWSSDERLRYLQNALAPFFTLMEIQRTEKETTLTAQGFRALLQVTPTVRDFSPRRDREALRRLTENGSVTFTEKRIMIVAKAKETIGDLP